MMKGGSSDNGGKVEKAIRIQFEDDSEINDFDLQQKYVQKQVKIGDSLHISIGENVMFVKEVIQKLLEGPYKLLKQIKFELKGVKQEFILRYMGENFFQICLTSQIGEEIFQLIEEFLNIQGKNMSQIELLYKQQIDMHYNQLIFNIIEENLVNLFHASFIFEISDIEQEWKQQVVKNIGCLAKLERISTCWNTKLNQENILTLLNTCKKNKYLLIQAQNLLLYYREPSPSNKNDDATSQRSQTLAPYISTKCFFLDVSFFKPSIIEDCDVMKMKDVWKWIIQRASSYISIHMKFATSTQINKIILPILDSILKVNQSICFDSSDLKLEYDLPKRYLYIHFKEDQQQAKAFRPEDWSFIQPFIGQYKLTTHKMQVNLENISFRHNNKYIYQQIIDFSKINHKINQFTIIAPLIIIQQDLKLKNLWKPHLSNLQILVNCQIQPISNISITQSQPQQKQLMNQSQPGQPQQKQQLTHLQIQALKSVDNKIITAVQRYRKNQYEVIITDMELIHQSFHLYHVLKQQEEFMSMVFKSNSQKRLQKLERDTLLQSYQLDTDVRERLLKSQQEKIIDYKNQHEQYKGYQNQQKLFFLFDKNSKDRNIAIKFNMRFKIPEFFNQMVSINEFHHVNDLTMQLQPDLHDGKIDQMLQLFSTTKNIKNLTLKFLCNNLAQLVAKLIKFTKLISRTLQSLEIIIDGEYKGVVDKDWMKNIVSILPFGAEVKSFKKGIFRFEGANNLYNTQSMLSIFKGIDTDQLIQIKTKTLDISKDLENNFKIRVDCQDSTLTSVFDSFIVIHQTFKQYKISSLNVIINEIQFESFFQFMKIYLEQIKTFKVLFLNIDEDANKGDTYEKIRTIVDSYSFFDSFEMRFRDRNSKEDSFIIEFDNPRKYLNIYFEGNQVYSYDFNYDRLINICANLQKLYQQELVKLRLELTFDNNARFQRCILDIHKIKNGIFKNTVNMRSFIAYTKIMNQFSRTFEKQDIFDEQVRAINMKDKCYSKYALLYKGMQNSQVKSFYRREIIWDSISLMLFGSLHLNLKPILSKKFGLEDSNEKQKQDIQMNISDFEDNNELGLHEQERISLNSSRLPSIINQQSLSLNQKQSNENNQMILEEENNI